MKILLNILPIEKKQEMRENIRFRKIVAHGMIFVFLAIFYGGILLGVFMLLSSKLSSLQTAENVDSAEAPKESEIKSYEKVFLETNEKVLEMSLLLKKHISWEKFFRSVEINTPSGVFYTRIVTKNDYSFSMNGIAPDRETLLLLERNMKNDSKCFNSVVVPLSNKLVKEKINFQLDAIIEKSCIIYSE